MKRDIRPEEMEVILRLAARYPDLRSVEADLAEVSDLRARVLDLTKTAMGTVEPVQPRSVSDLLKLMHEGLISKQQVSEMLGLKDSPESGTSSQAAPPAVPEAKSRNGVSQGWREQALSRLREITGNAAWLPEK